MDLRIENGVLLGEDSDGTWESDVDDKERFEALIIPDGVTEIKAEAFSGNPWIVKAVIPGTVKVIGERAFSCCPNLLEVEISEGVERIETEAFGDCFRCGQITLPKRSLRTIGDRAFKDTRISELGCLNLEYIGEGAFQYSDIERVCIPGTVKIISSDAFKNCAYLETVFLQEGVEEIGLGAFANCERLAEVVFPDSLRKIGKDAFNCTVGYTDDGYYPEFLLPSHEVVIEDEWFRYVADTFQLYKR